MIRIYGASDDLIEIAGDWREELNPPLDRDEEDGVCALVCSDGTALKVVYDGCWRFSPLAKGSAAYSIEQAVGEDADRRADGSSGYSDLVTLDGDVRWVAVTKLSDFTKAPAKKAPRQVVSR